MTTNYALWGLFGPVTWPGWLLAAAVLLLWLPDRRGRWRNAARWLAAAALTVLLLFTATPLGYAMVRPLETRFPQPALDGVRPAAIVVLAGAERLAASEYSGRLETSGAGERVLEGAALAQRFPSAELWIVGGIRLARSDAADIDWTADAWRRLGVPASRIRRIDGTRDTCGNAVGVAAAPRRGAILLVTSASHMPRAVACFRRAGIEPLPYPVDFSIVRSDRKVGGTLANLALVDKAAHEWVGLAYYRLRGRTNELLPAPR